MSKKTTFTQEQINEIIRLYVEEKMGTPSIAIEFKTHKTIIARTLRENDIVLDQQGRRNIGGKKAADKRYYSKNKEDIKEYYKGWAENNRKELREYHAEWRKDNDDNKRKRIAYEYKKLENDPKYKLAKRTRTAVYTCLKEANVGKYRSTFDTLGYTLEELMSHLEKQFVDGMSWKNYGQWHVDHKIPMARFNFTSVDDPEFKLCWCLDNLQLLWGIDNLSKGSRYLL